MAKQPDPIKQAEAALDAAVAALSAEVGRHQEAKAALQAAADKARDELAAARLAADSNLPRARMVTRGSRTTSVLDVVIFKRTDAEVQARIPGASGLIRFRKDKMGRWCEYPRQKGFWTASRTLELGDDDGRQPEKSEAA